jgi:parvulin-like peptidyl-prolyl isomerase
LVVGLSRLRLRKEIEPTMPQLLICRRLPIGPAALARCQWHPVFALLIAMLFLRPVAAEPPSEATAATVGAESISIGEVDRFLARVLRGKKPAPALLPQARAQALEELIGRWLVLAYAQRTGTPPSDAEIDAARSQFNQRLTTQHRTLADYLKRESFTEDDLQRQLTWNVVWDKFLARYLTAQRREAWFAAHHVDLDGTELLVSHVLLRPGANANAATIDGLLKQAESMRAEIISGKTPFAEAARQHSAGPSRQDGGRLGWITRHSPMDEAFSRAAFALKPGEVSPPVRSPFGVHLIRCDDVRPGKKRLADVRQDVDDALSRELFDKLVRLERRTTPVKYTGAWPHFKPGSQELAEGK